MVQKIQQGEPHQAESEGYQLSTPHASTTKAEMILSGAMQEFLENGYAGTSMDRVAATAGVSKATVYSHFNDKEGLFAALVRKMAAEKMALISSEQMMEGTAEQVITQILRIGFDQLQEDERYLSLIRLIIGESGRFPRLAQLFVNNVSKPGIERLTAILTHHPALQVADPEATARIIMGAMVHYKLTQEILHGQAIIPFESDRIVQSLVDLICRSSRGGVK